MTVLEEFELLTAVEEPAMVMGFIPADLHDKLRRMAAELACSESHLVSRFVREALTAKLAVKRQIAREPQ